MAVQEDIAQKKALLPERLFTPAFTITSVWVLGFGIGVNTAIFSLIDIVLRRASKIDPVIVLKE